MTADLVITNALVVTADAAATVIRDGAVAVTDGRIARLGPAAEIGTEAREVIDARGMILMPGLINTHCHAADSLFRGPGRGPAAGAVAPAGVEGRGRDPEPRHGAARARRSASPSRRSAASPR